MRDPLLQRDTTNHPQRAESATGRQAAGRGTASGPARGVAGHGHTVSLQLDNGVWVLLLPTPKPSAGYRGVASVQLWIAAGAAAERAREHGCAHLLEHMVFKPFVDAKGRTRDLAGVIEALGGDVNAFTSHDETVFHATLPADAVVEAMDVMVTSVIGREFDRVSLAREQQVVLEEIRQYADDPAARSVQWMMSDLYGEHGYARPVLGEEHEVRSLTLASLRSWQRRHYRGERVLLVVAGPISIKQIEREAKRLLGGLPAGARSRRIARPQLPDSARVRVLRDDVQEAYLRLGWIGGTALDADGVALDVAAVALGQGESATTGRPFVIGIAGGTGSGKTTVARKLAGSMPGRSAMIEHDAYYYDQSHLSPHERAQVNYDHPASLESSLLVSHLRALRAGEAVDVPIYDFATHSRKQETRRVEPARVVIVEGILVFTEAALREQMDIKIFVDTDADIRLMRRIRRDIEQRGRTFESVRHQYYTTVRPMHIEYVEPTKRWADLIIPEGGDNRAALDIVLGQLGRIAFS